MLELWSERLTTWSIRVDFAVILLIFSELLVWQTPTEFTALEWIGIALVYLALAAVLLDLIARFNANDLFSLMVVAGVYGLLDGTLISRITTHDLPLSLVVRPFAVQPLVFLLALGAFHILTSQRRMALFVPLVAAGVGLLWGIWLRWFPEVTDEALTIPEIGPAIGTLAIGLVACLVIRYWPQTAGILHHTDWLLTPIESALVGMVLLGALMAGVSQDALSGGGIGVVATLLAYLLLLLFFTQSMRRGPSFLEPLTPPRRPDPVTWLVLIVPLLVMGWVGYNLPGSDDRSIQSDILFGALTAYGVVWLPGISTVMGIRAFVQLAREGT